MGVAISATSTTDADLVVHDTTGVTGTFSLNVPFGGYTVAASLGNYTFDYPTTGQVVNVAPGQTHNFGSIQAKTAGALNVRASRMRVPDNADTDATDESEPTRWAETISVMYDSTAANMPEGFEAPTYTIQTNTGTDGAWTDATATQVQAGDPLADVPGSFTIPTPGAADGGDGEFMVRVVTAAAETTPSTPAAPYEDISETVTITAVDPSASGVAARRQAAADSEEADSTGNFVQASWSAVTNANSDFRVVAQVTAASLGGQTVWVVLAGPTTASGEERQLASADISGITTLPAALPSGAGGTTVTVTEEELAAALMIAVEWVQGTPDATEDGPKWMRSDTVDLAERAEADNGG